ncbi:MAG: protease complex subunit PrcB family protein [Planctomycetota bacterium]|nr:protease complex subunit PrcB family protein [Planctomycetota bacterium]
MPRILFLAVLAALVTVTACRSAPSGGDGFRTIAIGYQTGIASGTLRLARNDAEWSEMWREHTSTQIPRPAAPRIDFAKEMVVCVLSGSKPTGGYGIEVLDAHFDGKAMVLGARETKPSGDAIVPMVLTRPYHMIATPITTAPFRLEPR